jgi:hypothetical protein
MPYNPSSAYPRHSTYVPPVFGRGFARGFNEPNWGERIAHPMPVPGANVGGAIQKAMTPATGSHIGLSMTAMARRGIISNAIGMMNQKSAMQRENARRAAAGPGQDGVPSSDISERPPDMPTAMQSRGGRKHVAGINERLGDIYQREETSTAMDDVVEDVLTTKTAGRGTVPVWRIGSRRRGGA